MDEPANSQQLPKRLMDLESTQNDIERMASGSQIHTNPFDDHMAGKPIEASENIRSRMREKLTSQTAGASI